MHQWSLASDSNVHVQGRRSSGRPGPVPAPVPAPVPGGVRRRVVARGQSFLLEDSALAPDRALGRDCSDCDQIVLPYDGAFTWEVGRTRRIVDANVILFVRRGEECVETHPFHGVGHAGAIITPGEELSAMSETHRGEITRPMSDAARVTMHRLLFGKGVGALEREEAVIALVSGLNASPGRRCTMPRPVVERAKEAIHARLGVPLSLDCLAHDVGVSPIYLTQAFTQTEGVPLYRYQTRLRLARALVQLPSADDLTLLALDLGFSSHSHFTAVFRASFGMTPSRFRAEHRPGRLR